MTTNVELRDYQNEAIDAVRAAFKAGTDRPLIGLPTGTGKTVVFGSIAAAARPRWRTLILAHRDELITQAADKLAMIDPELALATGIVKAGQDEHDKPIVIASVQTLARQARLDRIARDAFDLIVVDEAHHAAADSYQRILRHFGALPALDGEDEAPRTTRCIGVTATPERADEKKLGETFDEVVYHRSILDMIQRGYLCNLTGITVKLEELDLTGVKQSRGDYQDGALGDALEEAHAPEAAVETWLEHAKGRKTIIFTPTIALSLRMVEEFAAAGVAIEHVDGETPLDERRAILRRFSSGETLVVSNCGVLTEGYDEPSVSCILMARPTRSRILYVQCIGRGTRRHPDKATEALDGHDGATPGCLVIDLMGNTGRHSLISIPRLIRGGDVDDQIIDELEAEEGVFDVVGAMQRQEEAVRTGRLVAAQVDLFRRSSVNWQRAGETRWTLGGSLIVEQAPGESTWNVIYRDRQDTRILATGMNLEYAQGVAEDHDKRHGVKAFTDKKARWRAEPASDGQRTALYRWGKRGLSRQPGLTKGEASDALDVAIANAGDQRAAR